MKERIKRLRWVIFFWILAEKIHETFVLSRHIANSNMDATEGKMRADISIRAHALEKGMSIGRSRKGFGLAKAQELLKRLDAYMSLYGNKSYAEEICSVINAYIEYNSSHGTDMSDLRTRIDKLMQTHGITPSDVGGIMTVSREQIDNAAHDFAQLSQKRFAVRDYSEDCLDFSLVEKALLLCERTPSACNRQSWRIHIYRDKELRKKLFQLQGGSKGFEEDMQCAILVCGDMNCYQFHELNQLYVDGGIYAMNLMYALTYFSLANIPLTMGHRMKYIKHVKREMQIPDNEMPVVVIGVGSYKPEFKVARSARRSYKTYSEIK